MPSLIYAEILTGPEGPVVAESPQNTDIQTPLVRDGLCVFADARIDDRDATLARLGLEDPATDAEIILAAYKAWGTDCAGKLLGDLAFVIVDHNTNRTFCARDWIGTRPLYFAHSEEQLIVANDLAFMLDQHPDLGAIDETVAATSLVGAHPMVARRTLYRAIDRVPSAYWMTAEHDKLTVKQYWSPDQIAERETATDAEIIAEGRALLTITENGSTKRLGDDDMIARAVRMAVDRTMHVTVDNEIPRARGLGSSSAVTAAAAVSCLAPSASPIIARLPARRCRTPAMPNSQAISRAPFAGVASSSGSMRRRKPRLATTGRAAAPPTCCHRAPLKSAARSAPRARQRRRVLGNSTLITPTRNGSIQCAP